MQTDNLYTRGRLGERGRYDDYYWIRFGPCAFVTAAETVAKLCGLWRIAPGEESPQCNRIVDDMMNGYEFRLTRDGKVSLYPSLSLSLSFMLAHAQSIADLWAT